MFAGGGYGGGPGRYGRRRQQGSMDMFLLMMMGKLLHEIMGLEHKPPVTLALMAANAAQFFRPPGFHLESFFLGSIDSTCIQPQMIVQRGEWYRLFTAAFQHADAYHLYYNISSLLWKGVQLEGSLGSVYFGKLCAEMLVVSHVLFAYGAYFLKDSFPFAADTYYHTCAVGFSAVLFGLKTVLNHRSPGYQNIGMYGFSMRVPTKWAAWAELALAHFLIPQASFVGHLCGILAGLVHINITSKTPLYADDVPGGRAHEAHRRRHNDRQERGARRTYGGGTAGGPAYGAGGTYGAGTGGYGAPGGPGMQWGGAQPRARFHGHGYARNDY